MPAPSTQTTFDQLPSEDLDHERRVSEAIHYATDDQLAGWLKPAEARLRTVRNFIEDMKARLPGLEREVAAIAQNVEAVREQLERA